MATYCATKRPQNSISHKSKLAQTSDINKPATAKLLPFGDGHRNAHACTCRQTNPMLDLAMDYLNAIFIHAFTNFDRNTTWLHLRSVSLQIWESAVQFAVRKSAFVGAMSRPFARISLIIWTLFLTCCCQLHLESCKKLNPLPLEPPRLLVCLQLQQQ